MLTAATRTSYPDGNPSDLRSWAYGQIQKQTGIDFQTEVLDQISGDYLIAGTLDSVEQLSDADFIIKTDLDDAAAVTQTLNSLAVLLRVATSDLVDTSDQAEFTESAVGDDMLYTVTIRGSGETFSISFGAVDDQLILTLGDGLSLLAGDDAASLGDDPGYQETMAKLPGQDGSPFFIDLNDLITVAGLSFMEPPVGWDLPAGTQIRLGAIQSLGGITYADGDLTRTDVHLGHRERLRLYRHTVIGRYLGTLS